MGKVHVQRGGSSSLFFLPPLVPAPLCLSVCLCFCLCVYVFTCVQVSLVVYTYGGQRKMEDVRHPALSLNSLVHASHLTQRPQCPVILLSPSPTSLDL